MTRRPLVLVTTDTMATRGLEWSACQSKYYDALAHVGLTPLLVPAPRESADLTDALDAAAGVLLTGARSNVHPSRYGKPETEEAAPFDLARDALGFGLIDGARRRDMPILGICRGHQELNVAYGGTLHARYHEKDGRAVHHTTDNPDLSVWFGVKHTVTIRSGSCLSGLGSAPVNVNSVHTQAVDRLGEGLVVEALAPDGTVEAISDPSRTFVLGLQWHPEFAATWDAAARMPFDLFANASHAYAARDRKVAA